MSVLLVDLKDTAAFSHDMTAELHVYWSSKTARINLDTKVYVTCFINILWYVTEKLRSVFVTVLMDFIVIIHMSVCPSVLPLAKKYNSCCRQGSNCLINRAFQK